MKKILILGGSGMLGSAVAGYLSKKSEYEVVASVREGAGVGLPVGPVRFLDGLDLTDLHSLKLILEKESPNWVINCAGITKQKTSLVTKQETILLNSVLPNFLVDAVAELRAKLILVSTDCVFSGNKGNYREDDFPDARDLYGLSKHLGEVRSSERSVTLRTSIIGHENNGAFSLLDWFLGCEGPVKGFSGAIFSGVTTLELARIIEYYFIKGWEHGLFHVAGPTIDKCTLLREIARVYRKEVQIQSVRLPQINRSLDSTKFNQTTGHSQKPWREMLQDLKDFYGK
jgi:dTDP-4-dehydrorhamnose reductase